MMRIACLYKKDDRGMSGEHWTNNAYRFFRNGLLETALSDVDIIPVDGEVRVRDLGSYDAIILYSLENLDPVGLNNLSAVKIARGPDAHNINEQWLERADRAGISLVINHQTPEYVRKFLPYKYPYEQIIFGINEEIHKSTDWRKRKADRILLTGNTGRSEHYELRSLCREKTYVHYIGKGAGFVGDDFPDLLNMYRAAIAACTTTSVYKYFEIPACGCLSFMEVNEENGCGNLGFENGVSAVFINKHNYKRKMREYLRTQDDEKWQEIAEEGRRFVLSRYENKLQVEKLINLIKDIACVAA